MTNDSAPSFVQAEHLIAASAPHAAPPHLLQLLYAALDDGQPPRGPGRAACGGPVYMLPLRVDVSLGLEIQIAHSGIHAPPMCTLPPAGPSPQRRRRAERGH